MTWNLERGLSFFFFTYPTLDVAIRTRVVDIPLCIGFAVYCVNIVRGLDPALSPAVIEIFKYCNNIA